MRAFERDVPSTDRLSHLPDFILDRILSLLDTKTVVQTSVLSRRWRCVWKHVPALEFNFDDRHFYVYPYEFERFNAFVDRVLSLHYATNVETISYYRPLTRRSGREYKQVSRDEREEEEQRVVRVFEYAVSHRTRHLAMRLNDDSTANCYWFPESYGSVPNCNLESLYLTHCCIDDRFESFGFRLLTTLELAECVFESDQELMDPFSKFPCLKSLSIGGCAQLFSGVLKKLRIAGMQLHSLKLQHIGFNVEIRAPKLESFTLVEDDLLPLSQLAFASLDHAVFRINDRRGDFSNVMTGNVVHMLRAFRNVKSLTLGSSVIEVLCEDFELLEQHPSPFTRLETLNLELPMNRYNIPYTLVSYFLKGSSCASPNIKILADSYSDLY